MRPFVVTLPLFVAFCGNFLSVAAAAEAECHLDGTCEANDLGCRLYLAEPLPGSWGIFAGRGIPSGTVLPLIDIDIPVFDRKQHVELQKVLWNRTVTESLLSYREKPPPKEADTVEFASCQHHSLLQFQGCSYFDEPPRIYANAGATSSYQHCTYKALADIEPGEELLGKCLRTNVVEYPKKDAEWLSKEGFCVDHLQVLEQGLRNSQSFSKGEAVAIVPVAAISRDELAMVFADIDPDPSVVHWQGQQLVSTLLFCFSSLRPYAQNCLQDAQLLLWSHFLVCPAVQLFDTGTSVNVQRRRRVPSQCWGAVVQSYDKQVLHGSETFRVVRE